MKVALKRVYDTPSDSDGFRILVDRLWPRGLSKQSARVDEWLREIAPSNELRQWYHARPSQWPAFKKKYIQELNDPATMVVLERLYSLVRSHAHVTLLFGSRNLEHNNAVVLKQLLEGARKPPSSSGPAGAAAGRARARARARK